MTNRIVVNYFGYEGLVLLSAYDNISGIECDFDWVLETGDKAKFDVVKKYHGVDDYKKLKSIIEDNSEGFVIRFKSGFRMKIKGEEYVRLHRLITNFSNVDIWETLKEGKDLNLFLDRVPDEFDAWVRQTMNSILTHYQRLESQVEKIYEYHMWGKFGDKEPVRDKKEYAEWVKTQNKVIQPILFKMYDGGDYSHYLWRIVRPEYQKPFWNKED